MFTMIYSSKKALLGTLTRSCGINWKKCSVQGLTSLCKISAFTLIKVSLVWSYFFLVRICLNFKRYVKKLTLFSGVAIILMMKLYVHCFKSSAFFKSAAFFWYFWYPDDWKKDNWKYIMTFRKINLLMIQVRMIVFYIFHCKCLLI